MQQVYAVAEGPIVWGPNNLSTLFSGTQLSEGPIVRGFIDPRQFGPGSLRSWVNLVTGHFLPGSFHPLVISALGHCGPM